jgi:hypothetical protein
MPCNLLSYDDTEHLTTGRQILSSHTIDPETIDLVKRFTGNTLQMTLRPAGDLIGVKAPTVVALRKWYAAGARPEELTASQKTIDGIRSYMAVADNVEARRAALRIAADRLEGVIQELRDEAKSPDAGAIPRPESPADGSDVDPRRAHRGRPDRTNRRKKKGRP